MTRRGIAPAGWPWEAFLVVGLLAILAAAGVARILSASSFGWDEAMYASKARSLVSDIPAAGWTIHRPPGLAILGVLAAPWNFSDPSLRAITFVLGLLSLTLVWALARQVWGPVAGVIALAAALGARVIPEEIFQFHNDLASAGVLMLLMLLLWDQFERRPAPTRLLLVAAPIAAAAFYLRYGAILSIAVIGGIAILLWGSRMRRHAGLIAATMVIGLLLAVPHLQYAIVATGSPTGILSGAAVAATTTGQWDAFRQFVQWIPSELGGPVAWVVALLGVLHAAGIGVRDLRRRKISAGLRRHGWILGTAAGSAVLIAVASHAEARYQIFPLTLGVVAGAGAIQSWLEPVARNRVLGSRAPLVARAGSFAIVAVLVFVVGRAARHDVVMSVHREPARPWAEVGALIAAEADPPCRVITSISALVGWYSACETAPFVPQSLASLDNVVRLPTYVVLTDTDRQELPDEVAAFQAFVDSGTLVPVDGPRIEFADIYRLAP